MTNIRFTWTWYTTWHYNQIEEYYSKVVVMQKPHLQQKRTQNTY